MEASTPSAWGRKVLPASVRTTLLRIRSKSGAPSAADDRHERLDLIDLHVEPARSLTWAADAGRRDRSLTERDRELGYVAKGAGRRAPRAKR